MNWIFNHSSRQLSCSVVHKICKSAFAFSARMACHCLNSDAVSIHEHCLVNMMWSKKDTRFMNIRNESYPFHFKSDSVLFHWWNTWKTIFDFLQLRKRLKKRKKSSLWELNPRPPLSILKKGVLYISESVKQSMHRGNGKVWFRLPETLFFFSVTPSSHGLDIVFSIHDIESSICVKIFRSIGLWHLQTFPCQPIKQSSSRSPYEIFSLPKVNWWSINQSTRRRPMHSNALNCEIHSLQNEVLAELLRWSKGKNGFSNFFPKKQHLNVVQRLFTDKSLEEK